MFKEPFSFNGRIRRLEYGITILIYVLTCGIIVALAENLGGSSEKPNLLFMILVIPLMWFALAQGVKRSHDIGNSGWYILIPFYGLWLLFADSEPGINKWGENPKGIAIS